MALTNRYLSITAVVIGAVLGSFALAVTVHGQDSGVRFLSGPDFVLPDDAVAAGIDGTLTVSLTVTKTGSVKNFDILGGPIWPCKSSPNAEIKAVRDAVKQNVLAAKFDPAMKDGKPIEADLVLDFAIGQAYRDALREEEAKKAAQSGKSPKVVEAGTINGRAIRLVKPPFSGTAGLAVVRVLIDEEGNVALAGGVKGNPALFTSSRRAACDSKFSPTLLSGKPVRVSGVITYNYVPNRPRY